MTTTDTRPSPIYDSLVAEGFDPATVPPTQAREEREHAHAVWTERTLRKLSGIVGAQQSGYRTPRARKASKAIPPQRGTK